MISVCIATLNGEKYIKQQLSSIISQLGEGDEIVLSDDGSTDGTLKIVEELNCPLIRVLQGPRKGVMMNFQNALSQAKGDFIFLSDQDDVWHEDKVDVCLKYLNDECDCVVSDCRLVNAEGEEIHSSFLKKIRAKKNRFFNLLIRNAYVGCCMALKRKVVEKAIPFPKDIPMHDIWLGNVAAFKFKMKFIDECLIDFRRYEGNNSTTGSASRYSLRDKLKMRWIVVNSLWNLK